MVRTKLDNRIRILIENGVATSHRSMFVIVGDKAKDQVVILHHILSKATISARPSVLWCYKKELGFSSHRKKRMKELKKKIRNGRMDVKDDPFDLFISATQIRYCYYSETHKILGNTFGMLVLQDFEAITPNLLARTIETVEGGGIVVLLIKSVSSLKQLYAMSMDVHSRYRTESHSEVVGRFNERFILSLASCRDCVVVDDRLNLLPLSSHINNIQSVSANVKNESNAKQEELTALKTSLAETKPIGQLISKCKTLCQAKALLRLLDVITDKALQSTCSVTAARGRGKSAALGLAISGAIAFGYTNIFVTSPSPDNLKTLFEFVVIGMNIIGFEEHTDFELLQSTNPEFGKALVRINVFKEHRQVVQYIDPRDSVKLSQAELVVIDEAAAIPLPIVKELISGPYMVFLASTINGYEGTGRSLSLKLLQQLREQSAGITSSDKSGSIMSGFKGRKLYEISLEESIRYKPGDQIELWLNRVLCLDATNSHRFASGMPPPHDCQLLYVNRDTLFSFHKASEAFLHNLMSIYVSAHYKNSPNDLQMLSDAPAHHLFVLMGPVNETQTHLPEILAVVQVCLEGALKSSTVANSMERGKRAAGDLLPWTISQQFLDTDFPTLCGARIVRIAVHPDFQSMGYGSRALELLQEYYEGRVPYLSDNDEHVEKSSNLKNVDNAETLMLLEEVVEPRADLPPLLRRLTERRAERLDYLGVSFGLTLNLLKFWKRAAFVPVYLRQSPNDLTGEHTCIMLKALNQDVDVDENEKEDEEASSSAAWLCAYWIEFRRRLIHLLGYNFNKFPSHMALSILQLKNKNVSKHVTRDVLKRDELSLFLSNSDLKRLSQYARNMVDYHLITDLVPNLALLYFNERFDSEVKLNVIQCAILLGIGLQHKTVDDLINELDIPTNQVLALFNKSIRKLSEYLDGICMQNISNKIFVNNNNSSQQVDGATTSGASMQPTAISLEEDLKEASKEIRERQMRDKANLKQQISQQLKQFAIKGSEDDWSEALNAVDLQTVKKNSNTVLSVKTGKAESNIDVSRLVNQNEKSKGHKRKRKSFKDYS